MSDAQGHAHATTCPCGLLLYWWPDPGQPLWLQPCCALRPYPLTGTSAGCIPPQRISCLTPQPNRGYLVQGATAPIWKHLKANFPLEIDRVNEQVVDGMIIVVVKPPIIEGPIRPSSLMQCTGDLMGIAKIDSGDDLRRQGMFAQVEAIEGHLTKNGDESSWWAWLTRHDTPSPSHERGLAMILHDRVSPVAEHTRDFFRQSGLAHLIAPTGQNLVLLLALWFAVLPKRMKKEPVRTLTSLVDMGGLPPWPVAAPRWCALR
jgi:hypothetical protein